eukprot:4190050-Prymnesium_polylepis.1
MYPGSLCAEFERAIMEPASPINSGVTSWEEWGVLRGIISARCDRGVRIGSGHGGLAREYGSNKGPLARAPLRARTRRYNQRERPEGCRTSMHDVSASRRA